MKALIAKCVLNCHICDVLCINTSLLCVCVALFSTKQSSCVYKKNCVYGCVSKGFLLSWVGRMFICAMLFVYCKSLYDLVTAIREFASQQRGRVLLLYMRLGFVIIQQIV